MSFSAPTPAPVAMPAATPQMETPTAPVGQKPQAKRSTPSAIPPTFLGQSPSNSPGLGGGKTLLGQ